MFLSMQNYLGCLPYLYHVSKGQLEIISNRESIDFLIQSQKYPNWTEKFKLVKHARNFAIQTLGLNPKGGYIYFTKLNRNEVGWHVTACEELSFNSYTWWFPIVGSVPYKGFFDLEMAKQEEEKLIKQGYDTRLRITAGYSTLGWFSDPLFSTQLRLRNDELVALVIHEMAHATIYFKGDSVFNESYATFLEDIGTELFYQTGLYSEEKKILEIRSQAKKENEFIYQEIKKTADELKNLYESNLSRDLKLTKKQEIIEAYRQRILNSKEKLKFLNVEKFAKAKLNNENFNGVLRYNSGKKFFQKILEESNYNFINFHTKLKEFSNLTSEKRSKLLED
jgi:predicted aminopeptidase